MNMDHMTMLRTPIITPTSGLHYIRGTALEERTCQICNSQSIEDELHFILICNEYNELRINLFNSIKYKVETFEYLDNREMLNHIIKYEWKFLSKYLVKA